MSEQLMMGSLYAPVPPGGEEAAARAMREIAGAFTPRYEIENPRLALLDLSGLSRLFATPEELAASILETAKKLSLISPHIALATRLPVARRLALFRPGISIATSREAERALLDALPLESLEIEKPVLDRLRLWGLRTAGDLRKLPASELRSRGGEAMVRAHRAAQGHDDAAAWIDSSKVAKEQGPPSLAVDPGWAVDDATQVVFLGFQLIDELCDDARAAARAATTFEFEMTLEDGRRDTRFIRSPAPSSDHKAWRTLWRLNIEGRPPESAVLGIRARAETTAARASQLSFTGSGRSSPEKIASALARLQRFAPAERIGSPRLLDTHAPDRFELAPFEPPRALSEGSGAFVADADRACEPRLVLRVFRPPVHAIVRANAEGVPVAVRASDPDRFVSVRGRVARAAGPYRLSSQWWSEDVFSREEWDVEIVPDRAPGDETQPGHVLYRVFRDPRNDAWYVAGELD